MGIHKHSGKVRGDKAIPQGWDELVPLQGALPPQPVSTSTHQQVC